MHTIRVELGARSYGVVVGAGVLGSLDVLAREAVAGAARCMLVYDAGMPDAGIVQGVRESMDRLGVACHRVAFAPAESRKTFENAERIALACLEARLDRRDVIIALGGGITGDVAGLVAATYKRGLRWVQCPTTLLAMVDASVGGKTGVNLRTGDGLLHKNMVGAFHQPSLVVVDTQCLATLPARLVRCGLAECLKHAMIARSVAGAPDEVRIATFASDARDMLDSKHGAAGFIARNVALKARVVEQDELETASDAAGGRALLNLGHTFAHVIERHASASILHGEAVALGLIGATAASAVMGLCEMEHIAMVRELVAGAGLATTWDHGGQGRTIEDLAQDMRADKKVMGGVLRLVLPYAQAGGELGYAKIVRNPPRDAVLAGWEAIMADW